MAGTGKGLSDLVGGRIAGVKEEIRQRVEGRSHLEQSKGGGRKSGGTLSNRGRTHQSIRSDHIRAPTTTSKGRDDQGREV